jgi:glycosyltransferase involved in cell wall biosynthesis
MKPSVSVCITYHNECGLLSECVSSLLTGSVLPSEILIYDDASTFPATDYIPDSPLIRVIRCDDNQGPAVGRNALLRQASGEYIHFHDADDLFHAEWGKRVLTALEQSGVDAVFTEVTFFEDGDSSNVYPNMLRLGQLARYGDLTRYCIRNAMLVPSGTYRRSCVEAIGGYRQDLWQSEDYDFHIRLAASGIRYELITDSLVLCRSRPESRSRNIVEVYDCGVKAMECLASELPSTYRIDLADAAARNGSVLFRAGALRQARHAFDLANRLGPARLADQRLFYRTVGRIAGLEMAERIGAWYRKIAPKPIRRQFADRGI